MLDKKTVDRVIEQSKGNLKIADSPLVKGQSYPSLEWATDKKINSSPIKVGFSTYTEPAKGGMKETLTKALEKSKNRKVSWTREQHLKDARIIVRKMKEKNQIKTRKHKYEKQAA